MFIDIHTHNQYIDNKEVISIINLDYQDIHTSRDGMLTVSAFYSSGIHPWDVKECLLEDFNTVAVILKMKNVIAVGESGLDRTRMDSFSRQMDVFAEMISLSENHHKPMILHCVKAYSDIIAIRKQSKATMPWIAHGFNGSPETASQLVSNGIYLSFGESLYRNEEKSSSVLKNIPLDKIFLETDVSGRNIKDVYGKAAFMIGCDRDILEKIIFYNYIKIFNGQLEKQN